MLRPVLHSVSYRDPPTRTSDQSTNSDLICDKPRCRLHTGKLLQENLAAPRSKMAASPSPSFSRNPSMSGEDENTATRESRHGLGGGGGLRLANPGTRRGSTGRLYHCASPAPVEPLFAVAMEYSAPRPGSAAWRPAPLARAPEVICGGCCRAAGRRVGLPRAERRSPPPPPPPRPPPLPPPSGLLLPRPARNSERGPIGAAEAQEPAGRAARGAGESSPAGEAGPRRGCVRRAGPAAAEIARPACRLGWDPTAPRQRAASPEGHLYSAGGSQGCARAVPATWGRRRRRRSPCAALHPDLPRFQATLPVQSGCFSSFSASVWKEWRFQTKVFRRVQLNARRLF